MMSFFYVQKKTQTTFMAFNGMLFVGHPTLPNSLVSDPRRCSSGSPGYGTAQAIGGFPW